MSLEETVGYINRYLQQDYGEHVTLRYVDVDSLELQEFPALAKAIEARRPVPMVLVGGEVKTPAILSFAWVVNEFRSMGAIE